MTDEQSIPSATDQASQGADRNSHGHFQPVVLTDTVGAIFLGFISIILITVIGGLLIHIHKLKNQLSESSHSLEA